MIIPTTERIKYYIGTFDYKYPNFDLLEKIVEDEPIRSDQDYSTLKSTYIQDINRLKTYTNKPFWIHVGDRPYLKEPKKLLIKIRDSHNNKSSGIIANLNSARHWNYCHISNQCDCKWIDKKSEPFWRGSTTGIDIDNRSYTRADFVKDYYDVYDVAFSEIHRKRHEHLSIYNKEMMPIYEILQHKYVICIDGNDKASSLNWILYSNSVPIMPKPRFYSWLCEPWLKAGVHYVEVKADFSNLVEKIEWCKSNDKECEEIANNGKEFIWQNYGSVEKEMHIEKTLVDFVGVSNEASD